MQASVSGFSHSPVWLWVLSIFLHVIWLFSLLDRSLVNKYNTIRVVSSLETDTHNVAADFKIWNLPQNWSPKNQKINELPFPPKVLLPPVHQKSVLKFKAEVWLTDLFSTFEMSKTVWVECSSCLDWELESHVSMKCEYRQLKGTGRYWRKPYFPVKNGKSNHHCACEVKVAQLCPTLCDLMDCIVHGILQARILEWVAFPFSRVSSQPRDQTQVCRTAGRFFTSWATREA